jgi:hypothetical protein
MRKPSFRIAAAILALLLLSAAAFRFFGAGKQNSPADDPVLSSLFGTYQIAEVLAGSPTPEASAIRLKSKAYIIKENRIAANSYAFQNPQYIREPFPGADSLPYPAQSLLDGEDVLMYTVLKSDGARTPFQLYVFGDTLILTIDKDAPGAGPLGECYILRRTDGAAVLVSPEPLEADAVSLSWTATWTLPPKETEVTAPEEVQKLVDFYNNLQLSATDSRVTLQNVVLTYYMEGETVASLRVAIDHVCSGDAQDLIGSNYVIENEDFSYTGLLSYF